MKKLNIFMLGSDKTLIGASGGGDALARHAEYGKYAGRIDILVYSRRSENFKFFPISPNVFGWPSNSFCKPSFFFDALRTFKKINSKNKVNLIIVQDPFFFGLIGWWLKKKYGIKLGVNFHGDFWKNRSWLGERFLNRLFLPLSYFVAPRADAIRAVSQTIKNKLIERGIGPEKIRVIPTAINLPQFKIFSQSEVSRIKKSYSDKKLLLFVGRLHKVKNLPFLIKTFTLVKKDFADTQLLLIGSGPEKRKIGTLIRRLGLEKDITLLGSLEQKALINYYYAADLLLLPSFSEGRPKVLIEGGLCGLPAVATEADWSKEIIKHGENGYLVALNDERGFADRIISLLQNEPLQKKMSENSRLSAEKYISNVPEKLGEFWQEIKKPE